MTELDKVFTLLDSHPGYGTEEVPLFSSLNRTLAEDVRSDIDMPPFDKSAMDGYACKRKDILNKLDLIEILPAGHTPEKKISDNQCSKIMTGAAIPEGADMVFMIEDSLKEGSKIICTNPDSKNNICFKAEDIRKGEIVLTEGTLIKPHHIAILASVGFTKVSVKKMPRVGLIATGSELVEPDITPSQNQIRNSNSSQITAQLLSLNITPKYYGIIGDNPDLLLKKIQQAISENDIILITGGVSKGDFDYVPETIQKSDFTILVDNVAIQPGKPILIAKKENNFCFGLSGNPVSSFIQFNLFVKYFITRSLHSSYDQITIKLPLSENYERKKGSRTSFVPIQLNKGAVTVINYNGSAHIGAYATAHGFMEIPKGVVKLEKGSLVNVRQL